MRDRLNWTERATSHRAEHEGQNIHVRQIGKGWSWTWAHLSGRSGFATADLAKADAEAELLPQPGGDDERHD